MTTALASYTLAQLQSDLQILLGDANGTRFSTTQLTDAINFGIKRMCTQKGYTYTEALIPQNVPTLSPPIGAQVSTPTVGQFSLVGLAPDQATTYNFNDYIQIQRVRFGYGPIQLTPWPPTSLTWIKPTLALNRTNQLMEDIYSPTWITKTGIPQRWDLFEGNYIIVFPNPLPQTNQNGYISMGYVQSPALLAATSDTVDSRIPLQVQQFIKYAAGSWLLSLDNTDTKSLETAKIYLDTFSSLLEG